MKRALLMGVVALGAAGCILPTLKDLETERPRACDVAHGCLQGYGCVGGFCVAGAVADCAPGETKACGSAIGECRQGVQTCDGGVFGPCEGGVGTVTEVCDGKDNNCNGTDDDEPVTPLCSLRMGVCSGKRQACVSSMVEPTCGALSYGPTWETTESRCDGLDNDCDGQTDESLPRQACALTLGVCAGTTRACTGGTYPACTAADYLAHDATYEPREASCDGFDNDCDGDVDLLLPVVVSDAGVLTKRAVAAVLPGTSDVVTLYESSNKVAVRLLFADGGVSNERYPHTQAAPANFWAASPAIVSSGPVSVMMWADQSSATVYRIMGGRVGPNGETLISNSPAVTNVISPPGAASGLRLALTSSRVVLAYANVDGSGANSSVSIATVGHDLTDSAKVLVLGPGRNPSLMVEGDVAVVAWEDVSVGIRVAKVSLPTSGTGSPTNLGGGTFGALGDHDATVTGTLASMSIYWASGGAAQSLSRRSGDCTGACTVSSFSTTPSIVSFSGTASSFNVERRLSPEVLAWEEGPTNARFSRVMRLGGTPVEVSSAGSRRPFPLVIGSATTPVVFFDGEGATGAFANVVGVRRYCGL